MEEKKNNGNLLTIILFILLLIAVGVICYLLGSNSAKDNDNISNNNPTQEKENNKESENNPTEEKENAITPVSYTPKCKNNKETLEVNIDDAKYNNVVEYIKDQKNIKISLWYCSNIDDIEGVNYTLTEIEKNVALNEILNSKHHMEDIEVGGGACVPTTKISYARNDKQYFVEYSGHIMSSNDGNIYKIIDKSVTNTYTQEYCQYQISSLGSTINNVIKYER